LRNLDEEYQIAVYKNVRQAAAAHGMSVVCVQGALEDRIPANTLLCGGMDTVFFPPDVIGVDGVLLLSSVIVDYTLVDATGNDQDATSVCFPLVSVGCYLPQVPSVTVDSKKAMEQIITHIVTVHGAHKLLYIGGQTNTLDDRVRAAAFNDACEGKGFAADFPPIHGSVAHGEFHETSGMMVMRDYIASHENDVLDAVIAANDSMAIGAHKILQEHSLWKNCAITGFDDTPSSRLEIPALTTVRQPFELLGEAAVCTLLDVVEGKEAVPLTTLDAELCIRRSCGCSGESESTETMPDTAEMRYESNQQARYTHHLSTFGQQLATITTVNELIPHLQFFLTNLAVRSFYLFLNDTPSTHVQYNARLVFEHSKAESVNANGNITDYKKFFAAIARRGESVCLYHLRSGTEYLGLIVYDADDTMHAHICNAAIFIVNTIKRLQVFALESRLKLEAEVLRISELERLRFSMDLHDDICQRLAGISMFARSLTTGLSPESLLPELSEMIDETLQRTRRYAHDSFPMELDTIGLKEAVHALCRTLAKQSNCRIDAAWNAPGNLPLTTAQEINLYRIIQEALQNAVKHSGGNHIQVNVTQADDLLVVSVSDNGKGAPLNAESPIPAGKKERGGLGLMSMRFRANQLGADYTFDSNSTGTRVEVRMRVHAN
jgi:signal transduction histidine kinase